MKSLLGWAYALLNRCLRLCGFKLKRVSDPTRDFTEFFRHLGRQNCTFSTIIDVGIAHGTHSIYAAYPKARYYLVEPLEECRPVLERLKQKLNAEYHLVAAGASNTEAVFHVHADLSGSSLLNQAEGKILDGIPRKVPVRRLDAVLPANLPRPVLLKLDTQGAELQALSGLGDLLPQIDVFIIEVSLMKFRDDTPEFAAVVEHMRSLRYVVYDILEGHVRALDGALAQVDLVFISEDSPLRKSHRFFSEEQVEEYVKR